VQSPKLKPQKCQKQTKKTTNFVFIITSAPKNEVYSIPISRVRRSGLSNGVATFGELMTDMLCLCKDSEATAIAGELECWIRRPICVPRSFFPDLERSM
jgi:hypothetical protein